MRFFSALCVAVWATAAAAHPMVEHALEVVIAPDRVTITARITVEEVQLVEGTGRPLAEAARVHGAYVVRHLRVRADGAPVAGRLSESMPLKAWGRWAGYRA